MKMTTVLSVSSAWFALVLQSASAAVVPVPVSHVYAPKGFDANDDVQVVVSGYLPNLCYSAPKAVPTVKGETISVTVTALHDERVRFCPMMVVPYLEVVSVGTLNSGAYQVLVNEDNIDTQRSQIQIGEAPSSDVDNFVYANLSYIDKADTAHRVVMKGYNPSDCYVFDRAEFVSNGKDTYSVLPIMRKARSHCPMKMVPFAIEVAVPRDLAIENLLLHARSMNGKSVNYVFDNR